MAAPVAIGTRGTIGSLVRKEIEHFRNFESEQARISRKAQPSIVEMPRTSAGQSRPTRSGSWFLTLTWKRKKRGGNTSVGGFIIPSICSTTADVAHNYRILKHDDPESLLL